MENTPVFARQNSVDNLDAKLHQGYDASIEHREQGTLFSNVQFGDSSQEDVPHIQNGNDQDAATSKNSNGEGNTYNDNHAGLVPENDSGHVGFAPDNNYADYLNGSGANAPALDDGFGGDGFNQPVGPGVNDQVALQQDTPSPGGDVSLPSPSDTGGMYQPQGGSVRLDGIDLRQFDPIALRQAIAYVPQHVELLPGTLRENLLYADPTASDEDCIDALQQACAWEEVTKLSQGLDTVIAGENAETISFMLTQRIGLARAYIKSCKIILFDEASHSLGKDNDAAFAAMIQSARGKCTVIMATHREDHMRLADVLLVMKKGELVGAGTPAQVLTALQGKRA